MADSGKRTVYSVSSGEYSDYGILDLFEDKADAEANAARNPGWYVEEFELHPAGARDVMQQVIRYTATAWVNLEGQILDYTGIHNYYGWPEEAPREAHVVRKTVFSMISADNGARKFQPEWPLGAEVYEITAHYASDETRARKAVQERAAKVAAALAQGEPVQVAY